jgi:Reverse transcriptase (RNA-dependent DNA polymerase)
VSLSDEYQHESEEMGHQIPDLPTPTQGPAEGIDHEETVESQGTPVKLLSLKEIYNETEPIQLNYSDMCLIGMEELVNFADVAKDKNWTCAMVEEIEAIKGNNTWSLVEPIPGQKVIRLKWVFKLKKDSEGKVVKYKARIVTKGSILRKCLLL